MCICDQLTRERWKESEIFRQVVFFVRWIRTVNWSDLVVCDMRVSVRGSEKRARLAPVAHWVILLGFEQLGVPSQQCAFTKRTLLIASGTKGPAVS